MKKLILLTMVLPSLVWAQNNMNELSNAEVKAMLQQAELELLSRGVSTGSKLDRVEEAETRLKKLSNRASIKNGLIGAVLAAAVTANPIGLVIGGTVGGMVGRSKNYQRAEEKLATIEQEIMFDDDDFLSEDEMRLAIFAGDLPAKVDIEVESNDALTQSPTMVISSETGNTNSPLVDNAVDKIVDVVGASRVAQYVANNADENSSHGPMMKTSNSQDKLSSAKQAELESCYGRSGGDRVSRERLPHCFYMMY